MSLPVIIEDRDGTPAKVVNNAVMVCDVGIPPVVDEKIRIFRDYFRDSAGSEDMQAVGSLTDIKDYSISAPSDSDRYIHTINFIIADAGAALNDFGNLPALTNGVEIVYEDAKLGDVVISSSLKSNFDFVRLCNGNPSFGDGTAAFRASNVVGSSEAFIPSLNVKEVFGTPWGIKLSRNTNLKLKIRIKDDTTGVDQFDAIAYGYDRLY